MLRWWLFGNSQWIAVYQYVAQDVIVNYLTIYPKQNFTLSKFKTFADHERRKSTLKGHLRSGRKRRKMVLVLS